MWMSGEGFGLFCGGMVRAVVFYEYNVSELRFVLLRTGVDLCQVCGVLVTGLV